MPFCETPDRSTANSPASAHHHILPKARNGTHRYWRSAVIAMV